MFKKLSYFLPNYTQTLILFLLFIGGSFVGNIMSTAISALFSLRGNAAFDPSTINSIILPVGYVITFIPALWYATALGKRGLLKDSIHASRSIPVDSNSFGKAGWLGSSVLVVLATLSLSFVSDFINSFMPEPWPWLEQALEMMTTGLNPVASFIMVAILAPVFEELLCRGIVLRGLLKRSSTFMAITVSALFFAILHMNPWQAIPAFILGLVFGSVYYRTGSLKLTMLMHFTNNFTALMLTWTIPGSDSLDSFKDIIPGNGYYYVLAACAVMFAICIAIMSWAWKGMRITKRNR